MPSVLPTVSRNASDLDSRIKRIYDHLYANAAVRTPSGIASEVGKLIRTATHMEKGAGVFPAFKLSSLARDNLLRGDSASVSRFSDDVRMHFSEMNKEWELYDGEGILLSDADIAWSCAQLDGLVVSAGKRDVFGDAVEIFRTSWAKQSSGQFFTDARVTHLSMVLLRFDPLSGDDLIDICCGTGGFLLAGLDYIRHAVESNLPNAKCDMKVAEIAHQALRGQEVDPEICDVANASLVCRIGRGAKSPVLRGDSISPDSFRPGSDGSLHENSHHCAASNPPFGTKITVKDPSTLLYYDLANPSGRRTSPRSPDILLLERNVKMLKPGTGRLAIVIPYQILSGPQTRYIREWLFRCTLLEAVVDLPAETFQPHTGTKTSLLVVKRRAKQLKEIDFNDDENIFMSTPQWIGHDRRGKPVYRRTPDGRSTNDVLSDIEDVGRAFEAYLRGAEPAQYHQDSFVVPRSRVTRDPDLRLNARYYRDGDAIETAFDDNKRWTISRLGDITERIFFPTRFKRNYVEPGDGTVPFFGGANITQLLAETGKYLSINDPRLDELLVREGWILVTRSGSTGIVSTVPAAWDGVAMSEHVIRIVPKHDTVHPAWIQTYLRSSVGRRALARGVFGSVIDEITPEYIANLEIPIPKESSIYNQVVQVVQDAEQSRQSAIEGMERALGIIESTFRNDE